jgi:hypothetical protein
VLKVLTDTRSRTHSNTRETIYALVFFSDRWLVCMINALGYGNWDAIKDEVRRSPCFQFNWFMRSRSAVELQRRCESLMRL